MLRDYYDWWAGQMLTFVPERLRRSLSERREALLVEPQPDGGVTLAQRRHAELVPLGRATLDPVSLQSAVRNLDPRDRTAPVWLRLPAGLLLEKHLVLPLAAGRDLDRVLAYELDRETPFSADEAWWSFAVEQRDRQQGRITVRLSLVPKAAIEGLVDTLRQAGLPPVALDIPVGAGDSRQIPIDAQGRHESGWGNRTLPLAGAACAVLALLAIGLPFARQSWEMSENRARMAELKPVVDQAEALRRQVDEVGGSDVLAAEKTRLGDPLAVLAAATALLPDDTYLTDLTMQQRKLTLNGQSVGPAKLIGTFAADPTFKDPAFAAPSTHIEGSHTDTFSISAEARP